MSGTVRDRGTGHVNQFSGAVFSLIQSNISGQTVGIDQMTWCDGTIVLVRYGPDGRD